MGEERKKCLILRLFLGKRHFVWPPLSFLWCGYLAFKKGSYWSHLFHPVVIVVQSEKWTTLYECEIGLDFWRIWWCLVMVYKIHDKHSLNSFSAHVFSWKFGRTNTFPVEFFLFWKKHWLLMLLTQLEFNDFRIQSHQIWHDICTFMHDQKNPSIGLWEKNSQWYR